jgi:hypothetical protein
MTFGGLHTVHETDVALFGALHGQSAIVEVNAIVERKVSGTSLNNYFS